SREIVLTREKLNEILAKHTGQPIKKISKDTDRDFFMSALEAKEYGIVDRVIEKSGPRVAEPGAAPGDGDRPDGGGGGGCARRRGGARVGADRCDKMNGQVACPPSFRAAAGRRRRRRHE